MKFLASLTRRRGFLAAAAMMMAFGTGVVMQHFLADSAILARMQAEPAPVLEADVVEPDFPEPPVHEARVAEDVHTVPRLWDDARISPFGFDCAPELTVSVGDAAMLRVDVFAPCNPLQLVALGHDLLEVDVTTDAYGRATTILPALEKRAAVSANFGDRVVKAEATVPGARSFSRVILTWSGSQIFHMNAYEFGASRGETGHIRASAPKTPSRAVRGTGGFLTVAGDGTGRTAEVYSFPTGYSPLRGVVRLAVEADVTEEICGKTASASALQTNPLGGLSTIDVQVTLPACDRVGELFELKNLFQDMRLAGR